MEKRNEPGEHIQKHQRNWAGAHVNVNLMLKLPQRGKRFTCSSHINWERLCRDTYAVDCGEAPIQCHATQFRCLWWRNLREHRKQLSCCGWLLLCAQGLRLRPSPLVRWMHPAWIHRETGQS